MEELALFVLPLLPENSEDEHIQELIEDNSQPDSSTGEIDAAAAAEVTEYCEICYEESEKRRYFNNNADRRKHLLTHTRPFKCNVSGCDNHNGFASPHNLAQHKRTCHSMLTAKTPKLYYRCSDPSC
ncbi:hypothetical protein E4T44_01743 [Aureobasidium sp. EXF-8845]|nr:hypothetical protein E4T44_01743 [Aureobasidium sp. EXF-8845]KAI4856806.1 hypothetical protein E4T45_01717 [Aureobasidium sp. EXF-8846]